MLAAMVPAMPAAALWHLTAIWKPGLSLVLQIIRFDTVHTLIHRYGMTDFAQFIQMETKRIKYSWPFGSPMNLTQNNKATKSLCKKCVKSIHESMQSNNRSSAVNIQRNKKFCFVVFGSAWKK